MPCTGTCPAARQLTANILPEVLGLEGGWPDRLTAGKGSKQTAINGGSATGKLKEKA